MLKLLIKAFVKNSENVTDPKVRGAYGTLCSVYGIFLNVLLFAGKYFAGLISGSVAVIADAFNNLADAGSSIITLLGFALSNRKPDPDHPFGHGRIEYLTGLALSVLIIVMGVELGKSSFEKILSPEPIDVGLLPALILVASIAVKFYMSMYNRSIGKKISSAAMQATATDALSDSVSTAVVLLSMIVTWIFKINIDAYAGFAVALFIIYAGFNATKETLAPLLGQAPDPELVQGIKDTVLSHPEIHNIHDMIVHDYGPGRTYVTLHAEVDGHADVFGLHDVIDNAESEIMAKHGIHATIHLDPIDLTNGELMQLRDDIEKKIQAVYPQVTIHDFRMVPGPTHTNVIFDALAPFDLKAKDAELAIEIRRIVRSNWENYFAVVTIDRSYVK